MSHKQRLLLIEDEEDVASLIKMQAELLGYKLQVEVDGLSGFRAVEREKPDLIILDIMLPGQSGLDVCRKIKSNPDLRNIPVIILSAKGEEFDMILGLELGADDYVAKPFSPKILFSRIKALLRRGKESTKVDKVLTFGEFTLEVDRYLLRRKDQPIAVTLSEFGILKKLLLNRGKVLTRNQLLEDIHSEVVDRNIDVHIASLRKKLGPDFDWIDTVRGVGYRFREDKSTSAL
jgi:two-component system, OmpR family, alkaline phosphatase synthesis response regulator PhoP